MDVDGTLTDGKLHISDSGEFFKSFNVKDGYGINVLCKQNNIVPVIITARNSEIVKKRAEEIGIVEVYQGVKDKVTVMNRVSEKYNIDLRNSAYIGDDIPDLDCMKLCGYAGCPADAVEEVKKICDFISVKKGGDGAVRDFINWLIKL